MQHVAERCACTPSSSKSRQVGTCYQPAGVSTCRSCTLGALPRAGCSSEGVVCTPLAGDGRDAQPDPQHPCLQVAAGAAAADQQDVPRAARRAGGRDSSWCRGGRLTTFLPRSGGSCALQLGAGSKGNGRRRSLHARRLLLLGPTHACQCRQLRLARTAQAVRRAVMIHRVCAAALGVLAAPAGLHAAAAGADRRAVPSPGPVVDGCGGQVHHSRSPGEWQQRRLIDLRNNLVLYWVPAG